jgi:hypothetical protein
LLVPAGGSTPPLPTTSAHEGAIVVGGRVAGELHPCSPPCVGPSMTSPHAGVDQRGRVVYAG